MHQGPEKTLTNTQKRNCRHCYFSRVIADGLHCVKNPPAVDCDTGEAHWPAVEENDICGAFRYADEYNIEADHWPKNELPIYRDQFGDYCKIPLTQGRFAKVDPEDYMWLSQFRWFCQRGRSKYYAAVNASRRNKAKRKTILMHRLIMGTPEHLVCDHINRNGLDNRKRNLRNCTQAENSLNQGSRRDSTSRFKGVSWLKGAEKWMAQIHVNGKSKYLGYFDDEIQAAKTYDEAAKKYHGEFANLNFATKAPRR